MKKFIVAVLGLLSFFTLVQYHAPPVSTEVNDITIEENPGQFVDVFAIENPVEFRAAEVVIKGPGSEIIMICNRIEEQNLSDVAILLIRLPILYEKKVMTRALINKSLCPRVLSLFPNLPTA